MTLSAALITVGLLGFLGMTWLFPLLGQVLWRIGRPPSAPGPSQTGTPRPLRVSVLIPAHNEQESLGRTLQSVRRAMEACAETDPGVRFEIQVGADGCTDQTAELARAQGALTHELSARGKWRTLIALTQAARAADWVVFADAGIEWPADFLAKAAPLFRRQELLAVAPTYRVSDSGPLERWLWSIERHFKSLETSAGGPVSIHGATVAYRRPELLGVFESLSQTQWLNDDVVIPLTLRSRHPGQRILYTTEIFALDRLRAVKPATAARPGAPAPEFRRRRRLVMGNIQWVRWAIAGTGSHVASALAYRRIFRLFWAYWGLALAGGLSLACLPPALTLCAAVSASLAVTWIRIRGRRAAEPGAIEKLLDAGIASFLAPYYLLTYSSSTKTAWK